MKVKILLGLLIMGFNGYTMMDPEGNSGSPAKPVKPVKWTALIENGYHYLARAAATAEQIAKFNLGPYGTLGDEWDRHPQRNKDKKESA